MVVPSVACTSQSMASRSSRVCPASTPRRRKSSTFVH
jgi:hypothetical protein